MTPKQAELYQLLLDRIDDPVCPTYLELAAALDLKSKAGVHRLLEALEAQGLVQRVGKRARTVRAVRRNRCEGIPTSEMLAEISRRSERPPIDMDQLAIVILDSLYGPRMGAFYMSKRMSGDTRHKEGPRVAQRAIDFIYRKD